MHLRKTRYYGIGGRSISLVFLDCVSDEHPELLSDVPAPPPQAAAAEEADEMALESEGA